MEVNCEGCAGCCIDWRALAPDLEHDEGTGARRPLDDAHNLVPLERDEIRDLLSSGYGDVLTPRLWRIVDATGAAADDATGPTETVAIDGYELAAVDGRPVFYVGLRKPPKPVAPFDIEAAEWLPTCVFLDPTTLQCRIHGGDHYPNACAAYPGYNLLLEQETECERVERVHGGDRLVDDEPPTDPPGLQLGPQALGAKLFAHPDPGDLSGSIERIAEGSPTDEDRASFVGVAAAASPGTLSIDDERRSAARERALAADSWAGRAIAEWTERAGTEPADPDAAEHVEDARGAPGTSGWE